MSTISQQICPQCGAPVSTDAAGGLCPRCVMALNFKTETVFTDDPIEPGVVPTPAELAPFFPQLEILNCLGRGGMGVVYRARQPKLDRLVALKILAPERVKDSRFADRFLREAQALAKLSHPNIVTIHDFGQSGSYFYLLMEFVDGLNLRELLRAGRMSSKEALAIVPPICTALQYAHDRGIVHRDIKPENILLDKEGKVKIADFGIAMIMGNSETGAKTGATSGAPGLTTEKILGTPKYMAPEQAEKPSEVDHRADIYSLGVVFYEMLTGELPGKNLEPPSWKVQMDVRLDQVVLRALEKKPELRFQQASVFQTQVETIAGSPGAADAPEAKVPWSQRGVDYRSRTTVFGLPLLHVTAGTDPATGRQRVATGIIAIGGIARGVIAIGGIAFGVFSFGGLALGLFAYGGVAAGVVAFGGLGLALWAAMAGLAIGPVAIGGEAIGMHCYGGSTHGLHIFGRHVIEVSGPAFAGSPQAHFFEQARFASNFLLVAVILLATLLPLWLGRQKSSARPDRPQPPQPRQPPTLSRAQIITVRVLNFVLAGALILIGWAVNRMGIFFNGLYVLIWIAVPIRIAVIAWNIFHGSIEWRLWRKPLDPDLRPQWLQVLNAWIFWLLAALTLKVCLIPAQFTPSEFATVWILSGVGICALLLLRLFPGKRIYLGTNLALLVGSIFMGTQIAKIYYGPAASIDRVSLAFPVEGSWLVIQGGTSTLINHHYPLEGQRDALDIERIVDGKEKTGDPKKLTSYPSWGQPLYAPADGKIVEAIGDLDDNPIGQTDADQITGNHIVLDMGNGRFVLMAHLQKGSVLVATNDLVHAGQRIARCGNSGNTTGPHLHIQGQNRANFYAPDLKTFPMAFEGATFLRSGHEYKRSPFFVRRNDVIAKEPLAAPVEAIRSERTEWAEWLKTLGLPPERIKSDYIGKSFFPNGDLIEIKSVARSKNHLEVQGHYNLVSTAAASLTLNVTSRDTAAYPQEPTQSIRVARGQGEFTLSRTNFPVGMPHVNLYSNGHAIAELYFGTQEEAQEEAKLNLKEP